MFRLAIALGTVAIIGSLGCGVLAYQELNNFGSTGASIIEITLIYVRAQHYFLLGIMFLMVGLVCFLVPIVFLLDEKRRHKTSVSYTKVRSSSGIGISLVFQDVIQNG